MSENGRRRDSEHGIRRDVQGVTLNRPASGRESLQRNVPAPRTSLYDESLPAREKLVSHAGALAAVDAFFIPALGAAIPSSRATEFEMTRWAFPVYNRRWLGLAAAAEEDPVVAAVVLLHKVRCGSGGVDDERDSEEDAWDIDFTGCGL